MIHSQVTHKPPTGNAWFILQERVRHQVTDGLAFASNHILRESLVLVPKETTALALSGTTRKIESVDSVVFVVGYGEYGLSFVATDPETGKEVVKEPWLYAVDQHQNPAHEHAPPTQMEYLSTVMAQMGEIAAAFRAGMRSAIGVAPLRPEDVIPMRGIARG